MLLPTSILGAQIERARMLQIGRQNDGLVSRFPRQLDTEVPGIQRDKGEFKIGLDDMFLNERVEPGNCIAK